jgi:hypothetical protein
MGSVMTIKNRDPLFVLVMEAGMKGDSMQRLVAKSGPV